MLVTGAAGFLGSHLCDALLAEGCSVVGVDNLCTGNAINLEHLAGEPRFELMEQDICVPFDPGPLDYVFNFASPASPADYLRLGVETLLVGSDGTRIPLEVARKYGAAFLQASTSECYGDPKVHPQPEDYWGNVNPVGPRSVYDEAKRFSEALTMAYHRYHQVDTRIVRIFNTYGPRMAINDGRVVSNFCVAALRGEDLPIYSDGTQTRSFAYVDDIIEALVRMMDAEGLTGPVNIGNPDEFTVLELASLAIELSRSRSKLAYHPARPDDPVRRRPDISLAKARLGWTPKIPLREGLAMTIEHFREELGSVST